MIPNFARQIGQFFFDASGRAVNPTWIPPVPPPPPPPPGSQRAMNGLIRALIRR